MRGIKAGKKFKTQIKARAFKLQHQEPELGYQEAKYLVLDEIFTELPDGAYFAAMAEHGFEADTIIELSESISEKGIVI